MIWFFEHPVFSFILGLVVLGPLAKGIGMRLARGGKPARDPAEVAASLRATEQRLAETETRLAIVEEKLDFYEKLLKNPESRAKTPG